MIELEINSQISKCVMEKISLYWNIIIELNSPSEWLRIAFIVSDGAPVEFIEVKDIYSE